MKISTFAPEFFAQVAELVDALDSKSSVLNRRAGSIPALGTSKTSRVVASSRNPFFFCCFEQCCKPSPSPVFPAFTNLGQTGGTKGASNAIRCRFFRPPAQRFPLPPNTPSFRPASSLCGPHLLFSLCSACRCQKTSGGCRDTPEPGNLFPSGSQTACLPAFCLAACFVTWRT